MAKRVRDNYLEPVKMFGNLYFVGMYDASTHIIDTGAGLILIDPGYARNLPTVVKNIRKLGFDVTDVKYVILSHGHGDHAEGVAPLLMLTDAKTFIGADDLHFVKKDFIPDVLLRDGDEITLGNTTVRCLSTPGHTDGTMSLFFDVTDGERTLRAGMHGGAGTNTLVRDFMETHDLPAENRQKFIDSLERLRGEHVDIFVGNHTWNNDTDLKIEATLRGERDAFVVAGEWEAFLDERMGRILEIIAADAESDRKRAEAIAAIEAGRVITIVRGVKREQLIDLAEAMYRGGIRLLECTYDASGKTTDAETAENIAMLARHFGDRMLIGAGTVLTEEQVLLTKRAGGRFIISPDTNADVIARTVREGLVSIPGALTPTEVAAAWRAGADFVKLFPVATMGASYVKDLKAPLSHVRLLAVGGINEHNAADYLAAGVCGIGIASGIVDKKMLANGDFDGITRLARKYTEIG